MALASLEQCVAHSAQPLVRSVTFLFSRDLSCREFSPSFCLILPLLLMLVAGLALDLALAGAVRGALGSAARQVCPSCCIMPILRFWLQGAVSRSPVCLAWCCISRFRGFVTWLHCLGVLIVCVDLLVGLVVGRAGFAGAVRDALGPAARQVCFVVSSAFALIRRLPDGPVVLELRSMS